MSDDTKIIQVMGDNLTALANEGGELYHPTGRLKKSKVGLTRAEVISTFSLAFEMIGGTPRLAIWADTNPNEFFKLYGRLLPASSTSELDGEKILRIEHALPPPKTASSDDTPVAEVVPKE